MKTKFLLSFGFLFAVALSNFAQNKEAKIYYEFDLTRINCEDAKLQVDAFALELQKTPESKGYIIYYGGKINSIENKLPRRNESKVRMEEFMDNYQVSTRLGGNLKLIDGGYRKNYVVQFWVALKEGVLPMLSPTYKPNEIKFRKGKYRRPKQGEGC